MFNMKEKQIVIRIGEPCLLKDINILNFIKQTSVYFIQPEDLVFLSLNVLYDDFINSKDLHDPIFFGDIYCNNWKLVKDINSPIYLRTKTYGEGFEEEKWEDIGQEELMKLGMMLNELDKNYLNSKIHFLDGLRQHYIQKKRDGVLKNIGI